MSVMREVVTRKHGLGIPMVSEVARPGSPADVAEKLLVAIPAYNEQRFIGSVVLQVRRQE